MFAASPASNFAMENLNISVTGSSVPLYKNYTLKQAANTGKRIPINDRERDLRTADRLQIAGAALGSDVAIDTSAMMRYCASPDNCYSGMNQVSREGERFKGFGRKWRCNLFLCGFCNKKRCSRSWSGAVKGIEFVNEHSEEIRVEKARTLKVDDLPKMKWAFLTLTAPRVMGYSLLACQAVIKRAIKLFCDCRFFRRLTGAWIRGLHFGDLESDKSEEGHNCHAHFLLYVICSGFEEKARITWTDSVKKAWYEAGVELQINTRDGLLNIDLDSKLRMPIQRSLSNISNYIIEPQHGWSALSDEALIELAELSRTPRAVEMGGFIRRQCSETGKRKKPRRNETTTLVSNDLSSAFSNFESADKSYEDKGIMTENANEFIGQNRKADSRTEIHSQSLRQLRGRLPHEQFLDVLDERVPPVQQFMEVMLSHKHPDALFESLNGHCWTGINIQTSQVN